MPDDAYVLEVEQDATSDDSVASDVAAEVTFVESPQEIERLDVIAETLENILLQSQEDVQSSSANIGTVYVDEQQWADLDARVAGIEANSATMLFVMVLLVCAVGICAGGQLWQTFVQSFRR